MNKFGLPYSTYELIKNFLASFEEIKDVKIFGSRAKGNYKPYSDIDLVLYGKNISEKMICHIAAGLEELPTPYKFDVLNYETISNKNLKTEIDKYSLEF